MNDENEQAEVEESVIAPTEEDAAKAEAAQLGWKDKGEFHGPEEHWVDAQTFLKRGREVMPFLRKDNEKLHSKVRELESLLMEQKQVFGQFQEYRTQTLEQQKQNALKQLREARKQAIETSDGDAFEQIEDHIRQVEAYKPPTAQKPAESPQIPPDFVEWVADNPWYAKDRTLAAEADVIGQQIAGQGFRGSYTDLLNEVGKRIRESHPDKFRNAARSLPASVAAPAPKPRTSGKTWDELPAEAKDVCDRFVRTIPGYTREKYLSNYQWG